MATGDRPRTNRNFTIGELAQWTPEQFADYNRRFLALLEEWRERDEKVLPEGEGGEPEEELDFNRILRFRTPEI